MEKQELICLKCKSKEVIRRGFRKTENRGNLQRFSCKSCGLRFIENDGFFHMRNSPQKITCTLDLFNRGLSTRGVQNHFQAFFPHNSSNVLIYKGVKKYALKIANSTDNLKVQTGSYIEVDEMEFHRRKSHKKKLEVDKNWLIAYRGHWLTAIEIEGISLDNNFCERKIRGSIGWRKMLGGRRTREGAKQYAIIQTHRETWKHQGKYPYNELLNVLRN